MTESLLDASRALTTGASGSEADFYNGELQVAR